MNHKPGLCVTHSLCCRSNSIHTFACFLYRLFSTHVNWVSVSFFIIECHVNQWGHPKSLLLFMLTLGAGHISTSGLDCMLHNSVSVTVCVSWLLFTSWQGKNPKGYKHNLCFRLIVYVLKYQQSLLLPVKERIETLGWLILYWLSTAQNIFPSFMLFLQTDLF